MIGRNHIMVGFCGYARSGKDFCSDQIAKHIAEYHPDMHVVRYAMAQPIKKHINAMFGWDSRHSDGALKEIPDPFWGFSPRYTYQTFGTEWGRVMMADDLWVKCAVKEFQSQCALADQLGKTCIFIISDIRFQNELEAIRANNGQLVAVINDANEPIIRKKWFGLSSEEVMPSGVRPHVSESFVKQLREHADYVIMNNYHISDDMAKEKFRASLIRIAENIILKTGKEPWRKNGK